jgi:hypothetical protein
MVSISLVRGEALSYTTSLQLGWSTRQTHNAQLRASFCTIRVLTGGIVVGDRPSGDTRFTPRAPKGKRLHVMSLGSTERQP